MTKYKIHFTGPYRKIAAKFMRRHPELVKQYNKTIQILEVNPYHPSLRLHKLKGKMKALYSVSINMQYRLFIHFIIKDGLIIPVDVGTHDEAYQ